MKTTVIYTKSGSRYMLDRQTMTCTDSRGRKFPLLEWPEVEVGLRLVLQVKDDDGQRREMMTSEVTGCV